MDSFPAFVPLKDRRVIIVGEGFMAEEKAALFKGSPADLIRLPEGPEALEAATYAGAVLVFVASADEALARRQADAARAGGAMLVNVVDRPALCDFYTPAIVDRGAVVGAVGTTGQAPGLARKLKAKLDASWPHGLARLAALIQAMKGEARAALPAFEARRDFLESLLEGPAAEAALAGDLAEATRMARAALRAHAPAVRAPVHLRPAAPEDRLALEAIFHDTFESTWRPNISEAAAAAWLKSDRPAAYISERGSEFWVGERDGAVVGLIHWRDDFVHALHVRAGHARTGVGARLMDLAEAKIADAGFASARLETDTFNTQSRAFYAARGYAEADRYPDQEWDSGLTTLLLVKAL